MAETKTRQPVRGIVPRRAAASETQRVPGNDPGSSAGKTNKHPVWGLKSSTRCEPETARGCR